jgi:hypothetical protein
VLRRIIVISIVIFLTSLAFAMPDGSGEDFFYEKVMQYKTVTKPEKGRSYTSQEMERIKAAKKVVKKYWLSSHEDRYDLFSDRYKENIKRQYGVSTASEYKEAMPTTERVWISQTYEAFRFHSSTVIEIIVLAEWSEEGFEGKRYYYFDMILQGREMVHRGNKWEKTGEWKIANIIN